MVAAQQNSEAACCAGSSRAKRFRRVMIRVVLRKCFGCFRAAGVSRSVFFRAVVGPAVFGCGVLLLQHLASLAMLNDGYEKSPSKNSFVSNFNK
jgi:hypothetical protein